MLKVAVDADGVIVNLSEPWLRRYNELYNDNMTQDVFMSDWEVHERAKCGHKVYDIFSEEGFFRNLPALPGAIQALETLQRDERIDLFVVTAASGRPTVAKEKFEWFEKHCPFLNVKKQVILCNRKDLIATDILIDDYARNIEAWLNARGPNGYILPMAIMIHGEHNLPFRGKFVNRENLITAVCDMYIPGGWLDLIFEQFPDLEVS